MRAEVHVMEYTITYTMHYQPKPLITENKVTEKQKLKVHKPPSVDLTSHDN